MRYILTCGGTAGHINPAVAVAGRLQELDGNAQFLFIGAEGKMEMQLVPREGYEIRGIRITNISRGKSIGALIHNAQTLVNVVVSEAEARKIIREFRPDAVIGTGGYVCYPVLMAAHRLGIPTFVHESNAVPGLTTKMLADKVDRVMLGLEESRRHYPDPDRVTVTGTPVRGAFSRYTKEQAKQELGLAPDCRLVVSVWGSLGAERMNELMCEIVPKLRDDPGFRLIHSTGKMYYERVIETLDRTAPDRERFGADIREYIYDMPRVMAAADLILCRAGASTLAELCAMGKPVVIVPSPNVTNNHQEKNARVLEAAGGAVVYTEAEVDAERLYGTVRELISDGARLRAMSEAMYSLAVPDAADNICRIILNEVGKGA